MHLDIKVDQHKEYRTSYVFPVFVLDKPYGKLVMPDPIWITVSKTLINRLKRSCQDGLVKSIGETLVINREGQIPFWKRELALLIGKRAKAKFESEFKDLIDRVER